VSERERTLAASERANKGCARAPPPSGELSSTGAAPPPLDVRSVHACSESPASEQGWIREAALASEGSGSAQLERSRSLRSRVNEAIPEAAGLDAGGSDEHRESIGRGRIDNDCMQLSSSPLHRRILSEGAAT
jgi:hypothetical protein